MAIGDWSMPWNAKPDAGPAGAGHPEVELLGERPRRNRPGRLRLHGAGVRVRLRRRDRRARPRVATAEGWIGQPEYSQDSIVRRAGKEDAFTELVKNTYRVLLTRGLRGCYVYFEDDQTRDFFLSRVEWPEE